MSGAALRRDWLLAPALLRNTLLTETLQREERSMTSRQGSLMTETQPEPHVTASDPDPIEAIVRELFLTPAGRRDPYPRYHRLRTAAPVYWFTVPS